MRTVSVVAACVALLVAALAMHLLCESGKTHLGMLTYLILPYVALLMTMPFVAKLWSAREKTLGKSMS